MRKGGVCPGPKVASPPQVWGLVLGWGGGVALEEGPPQQMHATCPTHHPSLCLASSPSTCSRPGTSPAGESSHWLGAQGP